jgi:hypothetical protein
MVCLCAHVCMCTFARSSCVRLHDLPVCMLCPLFHLCVCVCVCVCIPCVTIPHHSLISPSHTADSLRVAFDSRTDVGCYEPRLIPFDEQSSLEGLMQQKWCGDLISDCGFEAITFDYVREDRYYALIEALQESTEKQEFYSYVCHLDLGMNIRGCQKLPEILFLNDINGNELSVDIWWRCACESKNEWVAVAWVRVCLR